MFLLTGKSVRGCPLNKCTIGQFWPAGVMGRTKKSPVLAELLIFKKGGKFQISAVVVQQPTFGRNRPIGMLGRT
jgi:hypothetical protein